MKKLFFIFKDFFENLFKNISRIFSPKAVKKVAKKQARVAHVFPFAPIFFFFKR
jgi:hypothetical protein